MVALFHLDSIRISSILPSRCAALACVLASTLVIVQPAPAEAQQKVAIVDLGKILNDSPEAKTKKKQLDDLAAEARKKVEARRDALQARDKKLKEARAKDDSKEAEQLRADARDFARFVKDSEEEVRNEFMKSNRALTEKALAIVKAYAEKNKIDLVLEHSEASRGSVLFADKTFDITDAVLKEVTRG